MTVDALLLPRAVGRRDVCSGTILAINSHLLCQSHLKWSALGHDFGDPYHDGPCALAQANGCHGGTNARVAPLAC